LSPTNEIVEKIVRAETSAELRDKNRIPLGDIVIAATSVITKARVDPDNPHITPLFLYLFFEFLTI